MPSPHDNIAGTSGSPLAVGTGTAMAHHGELLQGVFEGADGRLHRGLVTLPLPSLRARATFWPRGGGGIATRPAGRSKAARAAELALESEIPLGHDYGSSTANVIAILRAVAEAAGTALRRATIARLAADAEGASEPIAYGTQAVLVAQREGRVLEHLGPELPPLVVVSLVSGRERAVDTLALAAARYDSGEIELFRALRGLLRCAVERQDPWLLGRVATASARIGQRHLPKPRFERAQPLPASRERGLSGAGRRSRAMRRRYLVVDTLLRGAGAARARAALPRGRPRLLRPAGVLSVAGDPCADHRL